jgi:hypothetical protein
MKTLGQNYLDYWQHFYTPQQGLKNRFGIRVGEGRCWALIQIGDGDTNTFGQSHDIPVDLEILPSYIRMIVDEHHLNHPNSDLTAVLSGKKSFRKALESPPKSDPKRTTATGTEPLQTTSEQLFKGKSSG